MAGVARSGMEEARRDTAHRALRLATAGHHDRVDRLFSRPDLTDRRSYGQFLLSQARAYLPVEEALTRAGAAAVLADWPTRQRADLLRADLAALGLATPTADAQVAFESPEAILGGVYVLEGSRLGGTLLRRQVPPELPATFLGASDPAAWRRLLALLEERLVTVAQRKAAIAAARNVFTAFEAAASPL